MACNQRRGGHAALGYILQPGRQSRQVLRQHGPVGVVEDAAEDCDAERGGELLEGPGQGASRSRLGLGQDAEDDVEGSEHREGIADTDERQGGRREAVSAIGLDH